MEDMVTLQQLTSQYKGKKVFITGHTGFKGAWLMATLQLVGAKISGYALAPEYDNGLYQFLQPLENTDSLIADIRDKARLHAAITAFQPDFVFHLAAQPLVRRSYEIPAETFDVNVVGTANLLEAVKTLPDKCVVVVITTDKVYENKEDGSLFKETDTLGGYDPYSASKACTELVVASFRNAFFNTNSEAVHRKSIATARAGNVIGGGDWSADRVVPDIVRALTKDQAIDVRNPSSVRPWQHVLEPVVGYLRLAAELQQHPRAFSKPFNFGPLPGDHLTVRELVEAAIHYWGKGSWNDRSDKTQVHEAALLKLDITRAMDKLNWRPKLSATQAIEWTIGWYKTSAEYKRTFTLEQINRYLAL